MEEERPDRTEPAGATNLEWTVFLLGRHPWRGTLAFAVSVVTVWFVLDFSGSAWLAGVAAFVLMATQSSFFLPTRFHLDDERVRVSNLFYRRARRWEEFRGMRRQDGRLKLLTLPHDSRLDNYRGMLLLLPDSPERVLDFIGRRIEEAHGDTA